MVCQKKLLGLIFMPNLVEKENKTVDMSSSCLLTEKSEKSYFWLFLCPSILFQLWFVSFLRPKKSAWKAINSANFEGFASSKIDDQDRRDKPTRQEKQVKPVTSTTRPHKLPFYAISLPIYTRLASALLLFLHRAFFSAYKSVSRAEKLHPFGLWYTQ